jgi:hypothetical protein
MNAKSWAGLPDVLTSLVEGVMAKSKKHVKEALAQRIGICAPWELRVMWMTFGCLDVGYFMYSY